MSFPLPPRLRRRITDFEVSKEVLGDGSLAVVRRATEIASGKSFALKAFDRNLLRSNHRDADVAMEEHCLRRANHPGIIKLHASFRDDSFHYLVLDHCPGGELWEMVRNVGCEEHLARHYLAQILEVVQYLRDAQIVHRDLKAENVLLGPQGNCKLIDFGSAKDLANPHIKGAGLHNWDTVLHETVGTPYFMAPEVVRNKCSDFRSDTWSLGCLVFQVLTGLLPFYGGSVCRVYKKICRTELELDLPETWLGSSATDLIKRMVVKDPDTRLGNDLRSLEEHSFFGITFAGAHGRSAPIRTLEEMCIRHIGRRWKTCLDALPFAQKAVERALLRPEALRILQRISEVHDLVAGQADEGETSASED
ncbi:unnamed protein product [Durusdinium trenchii]|uniref:Protein kinase domain-containing protein n=1 Tax=Durusdinium trenchii TaxID=1381693 RepID=A0ABP0K6S4_9DINO